MSQQILNNFSSPSPPPVYFLLFPAIFRGDTWVNILTGNGTYSDVVSGLTDTYSIHDTFVTKGVFFACFTSNVGPWWCWCCRPAVLWWITGEMRRREAREKLKFTMPELQQAAGAGWKLLLHRMGNLVAGFLMSVSQKRLRFVVSLIIMLMMFEQCLFQILNWLRESRAVSGSFHLCRLGRVQRLMAWGPLRGSLDSALSI